MNETIPAIRKLRVYDRRAMRFRVGELSGAILGKGKEVIKQVRARALVRFRYRGALVERSFHVGKSVGISQGFIEGVVVRKDVPPYAIVVGVSAKICAIASMSENERFMSRCSRSRRNGADIRVG